MGVSTKTRCVVWARAAGRCQFPGCNRFLIGDLIAGNDNLNAGYIAHIVAEKPDGPRGDLLRSPKLADDPANLMLMCDLHHRLIDREELSNYPEAQLLAIKHRSERRIRLATEVAPERVSHMLRYGAIIGSNESVISVAKCKSAMIETHYPADSDPIDLSLSGLTLDDSDPEYFPVQVKNLRSQFDAKVRGRFESQDISHVSVFALAPIPLLIELGRLLSDITPAIVYQLHREPVGWNWASNQEPVEFRCTEPDSEDGPVALKLGISASINDERIHKVLGSEAAIWSIDARKPHNDCVRYADDASRFRRVLREQLNEIKRVHGEDNEIALFPAIPVSFAVEFGRAWMPKADLSVRVFDQCKSDGFVERHQLVR